MTTVLIVDDDPDYTFTAEALVRALGFEAVAALDAEQALALAASKQPDVVLMDLNLPGMGGCEAAKAMRAAAGGRKFVLVAVTGRPSHEERERCSAAGFDLVVSKPCRIDQLLRTLMPGGMAPG